MSLQMQASRFTENINESKIVRNTFGVLGINNKDKYVNHITLLSEKFPSNCANDMKDVQMSIVTISVPTSK